MNDLNRCEFIGRVGKIETSYTTNQKAVVNISLACNESWKDKSTGEKHEKCNWIKVVVFGSLAEIADKYVKKGDQLYIAGKLQTRKWQDKQGQDRYTTEIVIDGFNGQMQMLGGKGEKQDSQPQAQPKQDSGFDDKFDDDIPF